MSWLFAIIALSQWQYGPSMPTPRYGFAIGVVNNKIYVIGGRSDSIIVNVVEAYDPTTHTWDTNFTPMPLPRCFMGSAVFDDKIYIIGGMVSLSGLSTSEVARFDPVSNSWDTVANSAYTRNALGADTYQDKIYAIGGWDDIGFYLRTVECYDPTQNTWSDVDSLITPRINHGVTTYNGKIYVIGGSYFNSLNSLEYYIPDQWFSDPIGMSLPRSGHGIARYDNFIYIVGGDIDGFALEWVDIYCVDSFWTFGASLQTARTHTGAVIIGDTIYVVGGRHRDGYAISSMEYQVIDFTGVEEERRKDLTASFRFPTMIKKGANINIKFDRIKIYNSIGALVKEGKSPMRFDLSPGVYFIQVQKKGFSPMHKKIVVIE